MLMTKRFAAFFATCLSLGSATNAYATENEPMAGETPTDPATQHVLQTRIVRGGTSKLGQGRARSWVELDSRERVSKVVVSIPDASLALGHDMSEHVMALPAIEGLPFKSTVINWMPHGHAPIGIFDVPHFDVHFYMMGESARGAITLAGDSAARAAKAAPARFTPAGFVSSGMAEPAMGMHWIDPTAPEFNGRPFGATFIYGFYDGKMNFMEIMAAKAMIDKRADVEKPINQPAEFEVAGRYPTRFAVRHDAAGKRTLITLEGFRTRR